MRHVDRRPGLDKVIGATTESVQSATRPHGVKVMGEGEDTRWTDADGVEHSVRDLPTALERLAADLADGITTSSRMNTVTTAPPGVPDGYPEGAYWTQVALVDGALVEVDRWVLQDGAWTQVGLDAGRIVAGKIDAGLIDAVSLAAYLVTAGLIRTGATGQRLELTSDGLVLWLVDADGVEREGVKIGPEGATLVTVGDVTIAPGSVTAPAGNFRDLAIDGQDLADYVDGAIKSRTPRLVAIGGAAGQQIVTADGGAETGIFDTIVPGIRKDAWYRCDLDLTTYPLGMDVEASASIRYAPMPQGVMTNSPLLASRRLGVVRAAEWDHKAATFWIQGSQFQLASEGGAVRLLLTVTGNARSVKVDRSTTLAVYLDAPTRIPFSSTINRGGAPLPGSTTTTGTTSTTQVQTYVKTYAATGSTTYYDSDNRVYSGSTDVIQGTYDGTTANRRHGVWWFPSMTGDLSGATITGVEILVDNITTYAAAGGTGHFWTHSGANAAGNNFMNASFTRGQDRWLGIPSQHWDGFKNGSIRGFMAYTLSNSTAEYARFAGGAGSAKIRITYTK